MTAQHAKALMMTLTDNIGKYEKAFGAIQMPTKGENPDNWFNMRGPGSSN